jgi:hypothetical protein
MRKLAVIIVVAMFGCGNASLRRFQHDFMACAKSEVVASIGDIKQTVKDALAKTTWREDLTSLAMTHGLSIVLCAVDAVVNEVQSKPAGTSSMALLGTSEPPIEAVRGKAFLAEHEAYTSE